MLRLVTGRSATGKSHFILNEISQAYKENPTGNFIFLVPEQYSLEASAGFIEKMDQSGHIHMDVLSFKRLAHRVFVQTGQKGKIQIDDMGKTMLLRQVMEAQKEKLKVYGPMAGRSGFLERFHGVVSEFKRGQVSLDMLKEQSKNQSQRLLKDKLEDIVFIYEAFEQQMESRYYDEEDLLSILIEKMDDVDFLSGCSIWIDGFNGFTAQEYKVISKLMHRAKQITVALTSCENLKDSPDGSLFEPTEITEKELKERAREQNLPVKRIVMKKMGGISQAHREICAWAYRVFSQPLIEKSRNQEEGWEGPVFLNRFQTPYEEVEKVGQRLVSLVRDKGYRWRDIGIATTDVNVYSPLFKRLFSAMNIPYFLDEKQSIHNSALVQYLLGILRFFAFGYRQSDGLCILKTGLTSLSDDEVMHMENHILAHGIKGKRWWKPFESSLENHFCEFEILEILRKNWIDSLEILKKDFSKAKTIEDVSRVLFFHMEGCGLYEKIQEDAKNLWEAENFESAHQAIQIWNGVLNVFDQLVAMIGGDTVDLKTYMALFETGVSIEKIAVIPPARDRVFIGDLERSRSHDVHVLFILGANEGSLPKVKQEREIFSEGERRQLKNQGFFLKAGQDIFFAEQKLSLYQILCKPDHELYISYPLSDEEGKSLEPSFYVERFKKAGAVETRSQSGTIQSDIFEKITTPLATLDILIQQKRQESHEEIDHSIWKEVEFWYQQDCHWNSEYRAIEEAFYHKNQLSSLGKKWAKTVYGDRLRGGVNRFETYLKCPFSHFVSYGIRPKKRQVYKIDLPDLGIVYHKAVEKFTATLGNDIKSWSQISQLESNQRMDRIIDEETEKYRYGIFKGSKRHEYMVQRIKRVGRRVAWTLVSQVCGGSFIPRAWEMAFSSSKLEALPPLLIDLGAKRYAVLEGRVDRVDTFSKDGKTYVTVVDYKSGKRKWDLGDVYHGLSVQLIVYLEAILKNPEALHAKNIFPGGMFYFHMDDPFVESHSGTPCTMEDIQRLLRLDGVVTNQMDVIQALDGNLKNGEYSQIIPVGIKKNGDISAKSSYVSQHQFGQLIDHVKTLIVRSGQKIFQGDLRAEPVYYKGETACTHCLYRGICQFDVQLSDNKYRYLSTMKNEDILEKLKQGRDTNDKMD